MKRIFDSIKLEQLTECQTNYSLPFFLRGKITEDDTALYWRDSVDLLKEGCKPFLVEMLFRTLPSKHLILQLKKFHSLEDFQINVIENDDKSETIQIYLPEPLGENLQKSVEKTMIAGGYFLATKDYAESKGDLKWICLEFEPRFQSSEYAGKLEFLYHATPSIYEKKIEANGFEPKSKNTGFFYPDRVYLMIGKESKQSRDTLIRSLVVAKKQGKGRDYLDRVNLNNWTIYKIKVPENINLYSDPNRAGAFYTKDNIAPEYIVSKEHFTV